MPVLKIKIRKKRENTIVKKPDNFFLINLQINSPTLRFLIKFINIQSIKRFRVYIKMSLILERFRTPSPPSTSMGIKYYTIAPERKIS